MNSVFMKHIYICIVIFFLHSGTSYSQTGNWQRVYKSPTNYHIYGKGICSADYDNYFLLSDNADPKGAYIFKINNLGDTLFSRFYPGTSGRACVSGSDGSVVFVGNETVATSKTALIKCGASGETIWIKNYDSTVYTDCYDLITTTEGAFITCGKIVYDGFVMKTDNSGNMIWKKQLSGSYNMNLYNIVQSNNNDGYLVCGTVREFQNSILEGLIIKLDTAGRELWRKKYISPYNSTGIFHLKMTNIYGGYYLSAETGSAAYNRVILVGLKINESGDTLSWKPYPMSPGFDYYMISLKFLSSNKLVFLYYRTIYTVDTLISGAFITDTNGTVLSSTEFASTNYTYLTTTYVRNPQNIFFVGSSNHIVDYKKNIFVVKTDTTLYVPPVSVRNISNVIPESFSLKQNYPNPFNNSTLIKFDLTKKGVYTMRIFDVSGKLIRELFNQVLEPGEYKTNFNAANLSSGVYFYRIQSDDFVQTRRMVLIK